MCVILYFDKIYIDKKKKAILELNLFMETENMRNQSTVTILWLHVTETTGVQCVNRAWSVPRSCT